MVKIQSITFHATMLISFIIFTWTPTVNGWSLDKALLSWFKNSDLVAEQHAKHIASPQVRHMMKDTPLVNAPDKDKMEFASGPIGNLVSKAMAAEQQWLGNWKVQKIVEAAGQDFDEEACHKALLETVNSSYITLFSFVDCPWCLLAKDLLQSDPYGLVDGDETLQVIELEELGRRGKELRAAIALSTGRTSMPACFINGRSIGGFTDGFEALNENSVKENEVNSDGNTFVPRLSRDLRSPCAMGLKAMHESGELWRLLLADNTKQG